MTFNDIHFKRAQKSEEYQDFKAWSYENIKSLRNFVNLNPLFMTSYVKIGNTDINKVSAYEVFSGFKISFWYHVRLFFDRK